MSALCDLEQLSSYHQRAASMPKPVCGTFQIRSSDDSMSCSKTPASALVKHNCHTCPPKPFAVTDRNSPWHSLLPTAVDAALQPTGLCHVWRFMSLCGEWDLAARLQAHCLARSPDSLLSTEISAVRGGVVPALRSLAWILAC